MIRLIGEEIYIYLHFIWQSTVLSANMNPTNVQHLSPNIEYLAFSILGDLDHRGLSFENLWDLQWTIYQVRVNCPPMKIKAL